MSRIGRRAVREDQGMAHREARKGDGGAGGKAERREFLGGAPCLDLVNTVAWRGVAPAARKDRLTSFEAAIRWAGRAGVLDAAAVRRLRDAARAEPARAAAVHGQLVELRESVNALFTDAGADDAALATLNRVLATVPARRALVRDGGTFAWSSHGGGEPAGPIAALLAPLAWSAADLLTGGQRLRVRRCADADCGWLFLDTSRAGSRRWCSMETCGNRAKARRHHARQRTAAQPAPGLQVTPRSRG